MDTPLPRSPAAQIVGLTARPVLAPMPRPVRTAVAEIPEAPLVLIDVTTDQGVTGSAYIFAYSDRMLKPLTAIYQSITDMITDLPLAPVDVMDQCRATFRLLGSQGLLGMALSGLEMACWDALGKVHGTSVATLLGHQPQPLDAYDSYGIIDPKADEAALETSIKAGFKAIKIKIGQGGADLDVATVAAVRNIIGPDIALMVDFNQSRSTTEALARIKRLARFDLTWVEEPVHAEDLRGHAWVKDHSPIPIQTGENWWFPTDMTHAVDAGASDFAMLDLMKIGGISGWMRAASLAEAASLPVSSHIFNEASAHVLAATPTRHFLEYLDIASGILSDPLEAIDGMVTPRGPGLGITWDETKVELYLV